MIAVAPGTGSTELVILESAADFSGALAARPPSADQNHIMVRGAEESLRRFALRVFKRSRSLRGGRGLRCISYVLCAAEAHRLCLHCRLLGALSRLLGAQGVLRVVGPAAATSVVVACMSSVCKGLRFGVDLEAQLSPTGWTVMSARARLAEPSGSSA
jgi:hypothetical protein